MSQQFSVNVQEKRIAGRTILRQAQLTLTAGAIVSLVGPSGCGKSTLLRLVAGLDRDFRGSLGVVPAAAGGATPETTSPTRIGMVFQEARLLPWLTVAQNVAFAFAASGDSLKDPEIAKKVAAVLDEVGLTHAADLLPKALSGGMAQRVSIARALVREPQLLLLDEPFSALDVATRAKLHQLVVALTRKHATATLMVTHDPDEALHLSTRIYVLGGQPATIVDVLDQPRVAESGYRDELRARLHASLGAHAPVDSEIT
jgi:sulfonate transport system ATP-binding protein